MKTIILIIFLLCSLITAESQVRFNYMGQYDSTWIENGKQMFRVVRERKKSERNFKQVRPPKTIGKSVRDSTGRKPKVTNPRGQGFGQTDADSTQLKYVMSLANTLVPHYQQQLNTTTDKDTYIRLQERINFLIELIRIEEERLRREDGN